MNIKQIVIESLRNIGVDVSLETNEFDDINLNNYIMDSIQFASFIIELEDKLNIELPYESLSSESLNSLHGFCELIHNLL